MKVLFVSSGNSEEGISSLVINQANSLIKAGCNIIHFALEGKGLVGYLKNIFILKRYLKNHDINIIHAHYGLCGIVSFLAKGEEKLIISFMGDDILGSNNNKRRVTFGSKIIFLINYLVARFGTDHIIVKTQEMAKMLNIKNKLTIVPNGVNLSHFIPVDKNKARLKLNLPIHKSLAIFVSNPVRREKNYQLAETAMKNTGIELMAIFDRPMEELVYYYNSADLLILTSYHEGSVNVIKEAMACNCPIVSTDVGDVREIVGNTKGCYICSHKPEDVTEKIIKAIDFGRRTEGRMRIIELGLDTDTVARKIINIYQNIIEKESV